jgi:hypothetical protein
MTRRGEFLHQILLIYFHGVVGGMTRTIFLLCGIAILAFTSISSAQGGYLGFDKNDYPGDASMSTLRKSFRYTSYWLNNPPGLQRNPWAGKRSFIKQQGFGFLVLFNGRLSSELQGEDAAALGRSDGGDAVDSAVREGFPRNVRIFLDQEQGGRLLRDQAAYLLSWIDTVRERGARAGVYCSGIDVPEGSSKINTAENIEQTLGGKRSMPTSPGVYAGRPPSLRRRSTQRLAANRSLAIRAVSAQGSIQCKLPKERGC